jgi:hypothetical protein
MKKIALTQNQFALVDDNDFERLSKFRWHAALQTKTGNFVARRRKGSRMESMQEHILGRIPGVFIDHRNMDSLDNRKENLRHATHQQNMRNRLATKYNKTGYKGVRKLSGKNWFTAAIEIGSRHKLYLGCFKTAQEAAQAYDDAARKYFGEFARLNVINKEVEHARQ